MALNNVLLDVRPMAEAAQGASFVPAVPCGPGLRAADSFVTGTSLQVGASVLLLPSKHPACTEISVPTLYFQPSDRQAAGLSCDLRGSVRPVELIQFS